MEPARSGTVGEPRCHVQHPEPQQFRPTVSEVTVQGEQLQPGDEACGYRGEVHQAELIAHSQDGSRPKLVSLAVLSRCSTPGVGAVSALQEAELPDPGAGGQRLVAAAVMSLEQRQIELRGEDVVNGR